MVAGEEPYQDMTAVQVIIQVSQHDYRPPLPEGCPPRLASLMQRCWHSDSDCRCARHHWHLPPCLLIGGVNALLHACGSPHPLAVTGQAC
jgi:hypothetical protein